ncbi:MAG: hypothetical protein WKG07_21585 [Hymenobacter sp.]
MVALVATGLIMALFPVVRQPGAYLYGSQGDAIKNYYTLAYYVKYDHGVRFTGMNSPRRRARPLPRTCSAAAGHGGWRWARARGRARRAGHAGVAAHQRGPAAGKPGGWLPVVLYAILRRLRLPVWLRRADGAAHRRSSPQVLRFQGPHMSLGYGCCVPLQWYSAWLRMVPRRCRGGLVRGGWGGPRFADGVGAGRLPPGRAGSRLVLAHAPVLAWQQGRAAQPGAAVAAWLPRRRCRWWPFSGPLARAVPGRRGRPAGEPLRAAGQLRWPPRPACSRPPLPPSARRRGAHAGHSRRRRLCEGYATSCLRGHRRPGWRCCAALGLAGRRTCGGLAAAGTCRAAGAACAGCARRCGRRRCCCRWLALLPFQRGTGSGGADRLLPGPVKQFLSHGALLGPGRFTTSAGRTRPFALYRLWRYVRRRRGAAFAGHGPARPLLVRVGRPDAAWISVADQWRLAACGRRRGRGLARRRTRTSVARRLGWTARARRGDFQATLPLAVLRGGQRQSWRCGGSERIGVPGAQTAAGQRAPAVCRLRCLRPRRWASRWRARRLLSSVLIARSLPRGHAPPPKPILLLAAPRRPDAPAEQRLVGLAHLHGERPRRRRSTSRR